MSEWHKGEDVLKNGSLVPDSCCKTPTLLCGRRDHPSNIHYTVPIDFQSNSIPSFYAVGNERFTFYVFRTLTRRRAPPAINRALFYERFVNPSQLECQLHFFELCSARSIGNFALERVRSTKFREIRENFATQESILLSIHVLRKIIRSPSVLHL